MIQSCCRFLDIVSVISYIHKTSPFHSFDARLFQYQLVRITERNKSNSDNPSEDRLIEENRRSESSQTSSKLAMIFYLSLIFLRVYPYIFQSQEESNDIGDDGQIEMTSLDDSRGTNIDGNTIDSNSSSNQRKKSIAYPIKPNVAPGCLIPPIENTSSQRYSELCPLCREKRVDPCVSTGGYVFCYSCLYEHTSIYKKCPVSGYYCATTDIIRLFMK